jgi:lipopolysaccharide transport system permease protein
LFKRDFFAVYKKSFLGISWIILSPIIGIVSWIFLNEVGILSPGNVGIPYPAYVLISTSIWGLFMGFSTSASRTLEVGFGFILQVNYNREVLLIKQIAEQLANFMLSFSLIIIVLIIFGILPNWKIILLPILILPMLFISSALGLFISVLSALTVEMKKVFELILSVLMYITPIIYSTHIDNHLLQKVIKWNPLTYLVGDVRDIIIYGKIENIEFFIVSSIFALILFMLSWRMFFISEYKVIERIL